MFVNATIPFPTLSSLMADDDKANLYRRIVQQSNAHQVVDQMRQLGFWPRREGLPRDPPEEVAERAKIAEELAQLRKTQSLVKNPVKALAQERKRRWEESKKRRAEAKKLKEQKQK